MKKKFNPLVSVIINVHNGDKYIYEAINSVLIQTYQNWEVIVWDNKSTDKTKDVVKSFKDYRIKYFLSNTFTALGEARNLAIKKSKGSFIAFLDSDDIWLKEKLQNQIPKFHDSKVGIVICDTYFFNDKKIIKQLYKNKKPPKGYVFKELLSDYFISLETAVIRRESLEKLDEWFDPNFNMIEEYDLFVRIGINWKVEYVDQVLAKWRVHSNSWTWSNKEFFPKERRNMLSKFSKKIKNFKNNFSKEIRIVERRCSLEECFYFWEKNKNLDARFKIKDYKFDSPKWFFLYLLTFFPYKYFNLIKKFKGTLSPS